MKKNQSHAMSTSQRKLQITSSVKWILCFNQDTSLKKSLILDIYANSSVICNWALLSLSEILAQEWAIRRGWDAIINETGWMISISPLRSPMKSQISIVIALCQRKLQHNHLKIFFCFHSASLIMVRKLVMQLGHTV